MQSKIGQLVCLSLNTHKYSCAMAKLPPDDKAKVLAAGRMIDDADLAEEGRENDPHVTIKYGLHTRDHRKVKRLLQGEPPIDMMLGHIKVFPANEKRNSDAVVISVNSPDLQRLNRKISDALPHTNTYDAYEPHLTLAYVKPGLGYKYAGKMDFAGTKIKSGHTVFSDPDGNASHIVLRSRAGKLMNGV